MSESDEAFRPCPDEGCHTYWPGHHMHVIHAGKVGETPWGWRRAVVAEVGPQHLDLVLRDGWPLVVWHHEHLSDVVRVGEVVEVHEEWHALNIGDLLFNVVIENGPGPVGAPANLGPWQHLMQRGIVNIASGRGLRLHPSEVDQ